MKFGKKIGDKIRESVPSEFQMSDEQEKQSGRLKLFEPVLEPDEIRKISEHVDNYIKKDSQPSELDELNYINSQIKEHEQCLQNAERQLKDLIVKVNMARRSINILKMIKNDNLSFSVKWLVNRIGELKGNKDALAILESEIVSYIEEEANNKGSPKK